MKVLIIGGRNMEPGDSSAYWSLAARFAAAGHEVRCRSCGSTNAYIDVMWADVVICYSYGMARFKKTLHDLADRWPAERRFPLVVVVAGVPDAWMAQFYGTLWHLPLFVDRGVCLQVDATPKSCTLKNDEVVNLPWAKRDYIPAGARWVNVDCNELVAGLGDVEKHTRIKELPAVLDWIGGIVLGGV